ncbi:hypothetical protein ACTWP5_16530 [Streptomyces sp. 4N509B]|uniref:hypothetical protein n=1 Tax=Streptomyces sp. 4N509B TaxID=3457413 RepID=UPI003FD447A6
MSTDESPGTSGSFEPFVPADEDASRRHVRVRVEMVLEIDDQDELVRAAWARIAGDEQMPASEREQAARDVAHDPAEAVAYLVDPVDVVGEMPGVVLAQASWSSELTRYDPDASWYEEEQEDEEE